MLFKMTGNATGSGMGTAGLVGPLMSFQTMIDGSTLSVCLTKIILMYFVFPGIISLSVSEFMRKHNFIKNGDMRLDI